MSHLGDQLASSFGPGAVDGRKLLIGVPGNGHLAVRIAGLELLLQLGNLPVRQRFDALLHSSADVEQRVILAPPVPESVLLNPAADVVDHGHSHADDVERRRPR